MSIFNNLHKKNHGKESLTKAAERIMELIHKIESPNTEQQLLLASAHYALAEQYDLSISRNKLHINSAITILQKLYLQDKNLSSQLANAFFKRAELLEQDSDFIAAIRDYQQAVHILQSNLSRSSLSSTFSSSLSSSLTEEDQLLLIQCSLSIADILTSEQIDPELVNTKQPLYYVNQALEYLAKLPMIREELMATLAYTHQIAGLAFSQFDSEQAIQAFQSGISHAFKTEPNVACHILSDIYHCLSSLYEEKIHQKVIQKVPDDFYEYAILYREIGTLFSSHNISNFEEAQKLYDSLVDIFFRVLDPYLPFFSQTVIINFIDALIFAYCCVGEASLPNPIMNQIFQQKDLLIPFTQHIYWLVIENFNFQHKNARLLDLCDPTQVDLKIDIPFNLTSKFSHNILYMPKKLNTNSPVLA